MNKEQLEARILAINTEMQQLKANYAKLEGHLAESMHWMENLLKLEAEGKKLEEGEEPKLITTDESCP